MEQKNKIKCWFYWANMKVLCWDNVNRFREEGSIYQNKPILLDDKAPLLSRIRNWTRSFSRWGKKDNNKKNSIQSSIHTFIQQDRDTVSNV